jgi:hypothetical protein
VRDSRVVAQDDSKAPTDLALAQTSASADMPTWIKADTLEVAIMKMPQRHIERSNTINKGLDVASHP